MLTGNALAMSSLVVNKLNFLLSQLYYRWVFQFNNQLLNLFNAPEQEGEEVPVVDNLTYFSARFRICHCAAHLQPGLILEEEAEEEVMEEERVPMVNQLILLATTLLTRTC